MRSWKRNVLVVLATVVGFGYQAPLSIAVSFDFTSGTLSGSNYGNSVSKTSGGVTVTATGWGITGGSSNTLFRTGQIKIWSTGMGVCDRDEGLNCSNPQHPVDNIHRFDFLLFTFSQPVMLGSALLTAWASDFDATLWAGTNSLSLNGQTLAGAGLGTAIESLFPTNDAVAGQTTRTIGLSTLFTDPVNWFFIGASVNYPSPADSFKFKNLVVSLPTVPPPPEIPEPATGILIGTGLIGLLAAQRLLKSKS